MAALVLTIFVVTVKSMGGYSLMFFLCFLGLVLASICTCLINDRTMVKYGELYFDNIGIVGSRKGKGDRTP